jgi:Zn-dependent M28 family amino/carboxypeptidase
MGGEVHEEAYEVKGTRCRNLWVEAGARGGGGRGMLIVGAHYDSCPGAPGADDNATGLASLIEIARALHSAPAARTVRLVAFVNEEPPWFQTESMGSLVHARGCAARAENISAMIALETMGYYTDAPVSQRYPWPLNYLYPDVGNFIGFVSNSGSRALVRAAVSSFRENARFPSEGGAPPGAISGVGWSDHWSFWQIGVPAIMVTDTAPFRYPQYHHPDDLPDKVDFDRLSRVTAGLIRVVADLAATLP